MRDEKSRSRLVIGLARVAKSPLDDFASRCFRWLCAGEKEMGSRLTSCAGHRTRKHCALSAMLTVSQLSKSFAGRALFNDVSLQVNRGDRIGLVGPNGAGKST